MSLNQKHFIKISEPFDEKLCFVIIPFEGEFDELYKKAIKPTIIELGLECIRGDEIYSTGFIIDQIWYYIQKAGIIIADLSDKNSNVFYELGLAHALNKNVILITQSITSIPFDLRQLRFIEYENTQSGVHKLKDSLLDVLKLFKNEKLIYFDITKKIVKKSNEPRGFDDLKGLAIGKKGKIYSSDAGNHKIHIISSEFKFETSFGIKGSESGTFDSPRGIAIDNDSNIYVVDRNNGRIQKFDQKGNFLYQFGLGNEQSLLKEPWGISTDKFNNVYVSSARTHQIKKFDMDGRFIKCWGGFGKGNGQFNNPLGIAIDKFQNIYVVDNLNNRIQKFDIDGNYLLEWGTFGDEPGQLIGPYAIAIFDQTVFIAESTNFRIQLFDLNGNYLGKLQTKPENMFYSCSGLAIDEEGNIFLSNTEMHHIIKLTGNL